MPADQNGAISGKQKMYDLITPREKTDAQVSGDAEGEPQGDKEIAEAIATKIFNKNNLKKPVEMKTFEMVI